MFAPGHLGDERDAPPVTSWSILPAAGAACPGRARAQLSDEERRQYSEILALEDAVRGEILAGR